MKKYFVLTDSEGGWDNVRGIFLADSEEDVKKWYCEQYDYDEFPEKMIIHQENFIDLT